MNITEIGNIISVVGFPIVVCLIQIYINYQVLGKTNEIMSNLTTSITVLTNEIQDLKYEVKEERE